MMSLTFTAARLDLFEVRVGTSFDKDSFHPQSYELCVKHNRTFPGGTTLHLPCDTPVKGRYVTVTVPAMIQFLTICEVQVFGDHGI